MFCKYCGKQLDDDSVFCPQCGNKVLEQAAPTAPAAPPAATASTQRKLVIKRKKQIYGLAVTLGIWIDGEEKARIKSGGEETVMISSESHALQIRQSNLGGKFESKTFVVKAGTGDVYGYITPPLFSDKWTITFEYM